MTTSTSDSATIARALAIWHEETSELQELARSAPQMSTWAGEIFIAGPLRGLDEGATEMTKVALCPDTGAITVTSPHLPEALHAIAAALAANELWTYRIRMRDLLPSHRPSKIGHPVRIVLLDPESKVLAQASSDEHPDGVADSLREATEALEAAQERFLALHQRAQQMNMTNDLLGLPKEHECQCDRQPRVPALTVRDAELALDLAGLPRRVPGSSTVQIPGPVQPSPALYVRHERLRRRDKPRAQRVSLQVLPAIGPEREQPREQARELLERGAQVLVEAGLSVTYQPPSDISQDGAYEITISDSEHACG